MVVVFLGVMMVEMFENQNYEKFFIQIKMRIHHHHLQQMRKEILSSVEDGIKKICLFFCNSFSVFVLVCV